MKKKLTLLLLVVLVSTTIFTLVGCANIQSTLSTPTNLRISDDMARWNSVDGAAGYIISVDGNEYSTGECSYNLGSLSLSKGEHEIKVKAKGDGYIKMSSLFSAPIVYTVEEISEAPGQTPSVEQTEIVLDTAERQNLYSHGLGCGVNAFGDYDDIVSARCSGDILDYSALSQDSCRKYEVGANQSQIHQSDDISKQVRKANEQYCTSATASAAMPGLFTASYESKYSLSASISDEKKANQYFFSQNHYKVSENYMLVNGGVDGYYANKLSDAFLLGLNNLSEGGSIDEFFASFGTHVMVAVSYGAMLEISYSRFSSERIDSVGIAQSIQAQLSASGVVDGVELGGSVGAGASNSLDLSEMNAKITSALRIKSIGGEGAYNLAVSSFDSVTTEYQRWVNSLTNDNSKTIVDIAPGGLIPIWYFFPKEYKDLAETVKEYFINKAIEKGKEFSNKYHIFYESVPEITVKLENPLCVSSDDKYKYNSSQLITDTSLKSHSNSYLFDLLIEGCVEEDGKYKIVNPLEFDIALKLVQNPNSIETYPGFYKNGKGYTTRISNDTCKGVNDTSINEQVGKGAYFIEIKYANYTKTVEDKKTNICDQKYSGSMFSIIPVKDINNNPIDILSREIEYIRIVVVYEYYTDFANWTWNDLCHCYRIDYKLNFQKSSLD